VGRVTLQRMDNVGIVVESLDAAISFFAELGLELEGRATIEGDWAERVTGLRHTRIMALDAQVAQSRTPPLAWCALAIGSYFVDRRTVG
jgi:catechol 2,3-dioxygenase-like lactoylglutathione lyase family enzyme